MRTLFSASSRYELDEGGITSSRIPEEEATYILHVVEPGETIEMIAFRVYGDSMRWWEIADLNPQLYGIKNMLSLTPGDTIRVPA